MRALLALGAPVDECGSPQCATSLLMALMHAHEGAAAALIEAGAAVVPMRAPQGSLEGAAAFSPLNKAVSQAHSLRLVGLLLARGAPMGEGLGDRDVVDACRLASHSGSKAAPLVAALLSAGARLPEPGSPGSSSLLHCAAKKGDAALVALLLGAGADPNAPQSGATALQAAVKGGHGEVAALLVAGGAVLDTRLASGECALRRAVGRGQLPAVRAWCALGAARGAGGEGLLQLAVQSYGGGALLEALVLGGAPGLDEAATWLVAAKVKSGYGLEPEPADFEEEEAPSGAPDGWTALLALAEPTPALLREALKLLGAAVAFPGRGAMELLSARLAAAEGAPQE